MEVVGTVAIALVLIASALFKPILYFITIMLFITLLSNFGMKKAELEATAIKKLNDIDIIARNNICVKERAIKWQN